MRPAVPAPRRLPQLLQVEPFVVELDQFQGPLDLLLHLIRSQDIDIFDIPIATVTQQFQDAISSGLDRLSLDRKGEFLEMAATLVRVKAQLLLPRSSVPEWEQDPRADLVRRLLEFEYFQDVVHVLENAQSQRSRHFGKGFVPSRPLPERSRPELRLTLVQFLEVAVRIPELAPAPVVRPPRQTVSVKEKIALVRRMLRGVKSLGFDKLLSPVGTRPHVIASLLACLELAKQQVLRIEQAKPFGSIWLLPKRRLTLTRDEE